MKYKVGDKVRVRKDLKAGERYYSADKTYNDQIAPPMLKMAGKEVTISETYGVCYRIKEFDWNWTDEMFEDVPTFKVGDRVKVNSDSFKPSIIGKIGTIRRINDSGTNVGIEFDENINGHALGGICNWGHGWNCDIDTLELVTDSKDSKIVITTDGKTTTAKLYDGKKFVKSAEAKCSPDDKFDFERGAIIAFSRLTDCDYKLADEAEVEKPKFTKDDLKTGMFVLTNTAGWAVVADDKLIYEHGAYDFVSSLNDDLCFYFNKIEAVVEASSFNLAKKYLKDNEHILYRRSDK